MRARYHGVSNSADSTRPAHSRSGPVAEIEPGESEAERGDTAEDVGEPTGGDQMIAGRFERVVAETERLGEVINIEVGLRYRGVLHRAHVAPLSKTAISIDLDCGALA